MVERVAETSPRFTARMAGFFQLLESVTATYGQVIILGRLVVSGNAAATATNILGHERLFWFCSVKAKINFFYLNTPGSSFSASILLERSQTQYYYHYDQPY